MHTYIHTYPLHIMLLYHYYSIRKHFSFIQHRERVTILLFLVLVSQKSRIQIMFRFGGNDLTIFNRYNCIMCKEGTWIAILYIHTYNIKYIERSVVLWDS